MKLHESRDPVYLVHYSIASTLKIKKYLAYKTLNSYLLNE